MAYKKEYLGVKIIGGVLVLYLSSWGAIEYFYKNPEKAGQFGDQFGAVNALFSALALAGVIYTLIQQQQEMKAQRREFMNSRAYTLAYKQVELINSKYSKEIVAAGPNKNNEPTGYDTIDLFNQALSKGSIGEHYNRIINANKDRIIPLLRVLANTCDLLVRLQKDQMDDQDSTLLFNIIRYNLDKKIWDVIKLISKQNKVNSEIDSSIKSQFEEYLQRINRFNEIYYQIKKDTDDIDGK